MVPPPHTHTHAFMVFLDRLHGMNALSNVDGLQCIIIPNIKCTPSRVGVVMLRPHALELVRGIDGYLAVGGSRLSID